MIPLLLITHFVADFILQSREMGKKKSSEPIWLFKHLTIQLSAFAIVLAPIVGPSRAVGFALANAVIHGVIDWNIWRGYKALVHWRLYDEKGQTWKPESQGKPLHSLMSDTGVWQYWEDHLFYATIGFDQLLHGVTLVLLAGAFHL